MRQRHASLVMHASKSRTRANGEDLPLTGTRESSAKRYRVAEADTAASGCAVTGSASVVSPCCSADDIFSLRHPAPCSLDGNARTVAGILWRRCCSSGCSCCCGCFDAAKPASLARASADSCRPLACKCSCTPREEVLCCHGTATVSRVHPRPVVPSVRSTVAIRVGDVSGAAGSPG